MTEAEKDYLVPHREVAERVIRGLGESFAALNDMLLDIQPIADDEEFNSIRGGVGRILGRAHMDLLMSTLTQHPELDEGGLLGGEGTAQ